jgi:Cdc6-like AAA superfamily ATPase
MIQDQNIIRAVSRVLQRSERQEDLQKLLSTFVDVGILPILDNDNHQILYGRRGTGKTHVFKVLGSKLAENPKNTMVYLDARTL